MYIEQKDGTSQKPQKTLKTRGEQTGQQMLMIELAFRNRHKTEPLPHCT